MIMMMLGQKKTKYDEKETKRRNGLSKGEVGQQQWQLRLSCS